MSLVGQGPAYDPWMVSFRRETTTANLSHAEESHYGLARRSYDTRYDWEYYSEISHR